MVYQEDCSYVNNYKPFNQSHPNLSYRSNNVENPQDQVYPQQGFNQPKQQGGTFLPRPQGNFQGQGFNQQGFNQQGFNQPRPHYSTQQQGNFPRGNNFQGGNFHGNSQAAQGDTSQDNEIKAMLKMIMEGLAKSNLDQMETQKQVAEMQARIDRIATQNSQASSSSKKPMSSFPSAPEINPKGYLNVILPRDERVCEKEERAMVVEEDIEVIIPSPVASFASPPSSTFLNEMLSKPKRIGEDREMEEAKWRLEMYESQLKPSNEPKVLPKRKHQGKFIIPCFLGTHKIKHALCDSGAFVNVISLKAVKEMGIKGMKPYSSPLTFGDGSTKTPEGIIEDYPIKVGECIVPTDLLVLEVVGNKGAPLILGAPFLTSVGANIDYVTRRVVLKFVSEKCYYPIEPNLGFCGTMIDDTLGIKEEAPLKVEDTPPLIQKELKLEHKLMHEPSLPNGVVSPNVVREARVNGSIQMKGGTLEYHETNPPSLTFTPLKLINGKLECKMKSKGLPKPFSKARFVLATSDEDIDWESCKESLRKAFGIKSEDVDAIRGSSPTVNEKKLGDRGPTSQYGSSPKSA